MNFTFSPLAGERMSVAENPFKDEWLRALGASGVNLSEIGGEALLCEFYVFTSSG